jgi:hypothetical protein
MATVSRVSIEKVGKHFASVVRDIAVAREAWVSGSPDAFDLWLLVTPIDMAAELELYAVVDRMYERFPSPTFTLRILNPEFFIDLRPEMIVPSRAQRIELRSPR